MAQFEYTTTSFQKPNPISENEFWMIKGELQKNPSFDFEPQSESFSEHFSRYFMIIIGGPVISFILAGAMDATGLGDNGWHVPIFAIPIIVCFFAGIIALLRLFFEGPSYSKFLKRKRQYFSKMKFAIQQSENYEEFVNAFYIK